MQWPRHTHDRVADRAKARPRRLLRTYTGNYYFSERRRRCAITSTDTALVMSGRQNAVEAAARTIAFCEQSASLLATNLDGGGGGGGFAV